MYALIQHGVVWQLFDADPMLPPDLEVREIASGTKVEAGWIAKNDGTYEAPQIAPPPSEVLEVSSAQAKIQLSRAGFLPAVKASVEAIGGEVEIWFTDARTWQRNNAHVIEVGAGLNLSDAEIDSLFRDAAKIDA